MSGKLFICPTPIGNMEDMSLRMLRTLLATNIIAAEDTRVTMKLLNAYNIKTNLMSYHEHNKNEMGPVLIEKIMDGNIVTLVTDAGTPCISDPGADLVRLALKRDIEVTPIAGPCACTTALSVANLPVDRFVFEGFLPRGKKNRRMILKDLQMETRTIVFYESPHRLFDTLTDLHENLGNRRLTICRELTKLHESKYYFTIAEALSLYSREEPRGEFVLIVEGADPENVRRGKQELWNFMSLKEHMNIYISRGLERKEAMRQVAIDRDLPKRSVYMQLNRLT